MRELQASMGSDEFAEWIAYYKIEPFGVERDNLHAGVVASVVANANRDPAKQPKAFKPGDFLLEFTGGTRQARDVEREFDLLYAFARS